MNASQGVLHVYVITLEAHSSPAGGVRAHPTNSDREKRGGRAAEACAPPLSLLRITTP